MKNKLFRHFAVPFVWILCFLVASCSGGSKGSKKCFSVPGGGTVTITQTDDLGTTGDYVYKDAAGNTVETGTVKGNGEHGTGTATAASPSTNTYQVTGTEEGQQWTCEQSNGNDLTLTEIDCP
jgi:hypothetical protein